MHTPIFALRSDDGTLCLCWQECSEGVPYIGGEVHVIAKFDASEEQFANDILRAVNSHDDLAAAVKAGLEWLDEYTPKDVKAAIEAAITKAEGQEVPHAHQG